MGSVFSVDLWQVEEQAFCPETMRHAESLMSLGNGYMGLRGNFEEDYSGDTLPGTYLGGVWYPDKTRVGWWKNGYPPYYGKALNAPNLIGLHIEVAGKTLDAARFSPTAYRRVLDMHSGVLLRQMTLQLPEGTVTLNFERFVSMDMQECLALRVEVCADFDAKISITAYLDSDVRNEDSNYDESFWELLPGSEGHILTRTRANPFGTPRFTVAAGMRCACTLPSAGGWHRAGYCEARFAGFVQSRQAVTLDKLLYVVTDRDMDAALLPQAAQDGADMLMQTGYDALRHAHANAWHALWMQADAQIIGDDAAQQGIRFNLFHLFCTYTGKDKRLNIGPKGFTGEKYGGATYWDTEAFCFTPVMALMGEDAAKNLLLYRHEQLPAACENAKRLGLRGALFPMVTFNGEECHNEWEITFEEIHRNAAIVHAIYRYYAYTIDHMFLRNEGLDIIYAVAQFYASRAHFNQRTGKYMLHGVTGPNEYENNVNNNWYTNRMAVFCLNFCVQLMGAIPEKKKKELGVTREELARFTDIQRNMYLPTDEERGIFVQHDTFLDKDLQPVSALSDEERPLNQHWPWDKILRSGYIKQADVLQGLYFLHYHYDKDTLRRNFDFYEPLTVHESSLSPCVHGILACELGYLDKAKEFFHRTTRLDLDDINRDTRDGLHVTSMAGGWLMLAEGFAGMRIVPRLSFAPTLPEGWKSYSLRLTHRGRVITLQVHPRYLTFKMESGAPLTFKLYGNDIELIDELTVLRT